MVLRLLLNLCNKLTILLILKNIKMTANELQEKIGKMEASLLNDNVSEPAKVGIRTALSDAKATPAAPEKPKADEKKPDGRANNGGNRKSTPAAPVATPPKAEEHPTVEVFTVNGKIATVEAEAVRNAPHGASPHATPATPAAETEAERAARKAAAKAAEAAEDEAARAEKERIADEKEEAKKAEKKRKAKEEAAKLLSKEELPSVVKFLVKHASDYVDAKLPNAQELKRVLVSKGEIILEVINHSKGIVAVIPGLRAMATEYLQLSVKGDTVTTAKIDKPKTVRQVIPVPEYIAILYNTRGWDDRSEPHKAIHKFYKDVLKACLDGEITETEREKLEDEYVKVTKAVAELDFYEFGVAELYNEIRAYKKTHTETSFWKAREAVIKSHLG
jgi:uncharacterized protein YaiL (DUF2058 family)